MNENYLVVVDQTGAAGPETRRLIPQTAITIAVDTAYIASNGGQNVQKGIYMMDNKLATGSRGEGTPLLHTRCNVGSLIGFNAVAINASGSSGDKVEISGFTVTQGNVFTAAGQPRKQPALPNQPEGSYWIGQAMYQGTQTYLIQLKVTTGILQPVTYYINWDPYITAS